jgi:voltage-gated potassium channel Kch
VLDEAFTLV